MSRSRAEPRRVLCVLSDLGINGASVTILRSLPALDRQRFTCTVVSLGGSGPLEAAFQAAGVPVVLLPPAPPRDPRILPRLVRLLHRERCHILYANKHTAAFWSRAAAHLAGLRAIVTREAGFPLPFRGRTVTALDGWQSRRSLVLANSRFTAAAVVKLLGVDPRRIRVAYPPLSEAGEDPGEDPAGNLLRRSPATGPRIGFLGRLAPEKGCDLFLRSMARVLDRLPGAEAVVCGPGPLRQDLEDLARDLAIAGRTRFVGATRAPQALLACLDVVVVPSIYESFGQILPEAALAGVPVVAAAVGAIPEVNEIVGNARLVPADLDLSGGKHSWRPWAGDRRFTGRLRFPGCRAVDPAALAEAVVDLMRSPAERARLTRGAADRARAAFSLQRHVRTLEQTLEDAAGL